MIEQLEVYLNRACQGDCEAAYYAAHILKQMGESDELIQVQLKRAAIAGYAIASRELAELAFSGRLTPAGYIVNNDKNCLAQGKRWLELAASQNDVSSMILLAVCFDKGMLGLNKDHESAKNYHSMAEEYIRTHDMFHDIMSVVLWDTIAKDYAENYSRK